MVRSVPVSTWVVAARVPGAATVAEETQVARGPGDMSLQPKPQSRHFRLDANDVLESWSSLSLAGRSRASESRKLDRRSGQLVLKHSPTRVSVEGTIPLGSYSKKEMQCLKARLRTELWTRLEAQVKRMCCLPER